MEFVHLIEKDDPKNNLHMQLVSLDSKACETLYLIQDYVLHTKAFTDGDDGYRPIAEHEVVMTIPIRWPEEGWGLTSGEPKWW